MQNISFIHNTGNTYTGTFYAPFCNKMPSEYSEVAMTMNASSQRRAPISSGSDGWTTMPDTGETDLSRNNAPIGDAWVLLIYALLWGIWKGNKTRRKKLSTVLLLCAVSVQAGITALDFSPVSPEAGRQVSITPTISSVPDGNVSVCWSVYYDADAVNEVTGIRFHQDYSSGPNAVWFTAPIDAGTYYVKTSLHTGSVCGGLLNSYYIHPLIVYPSDADIVIMRDAQESGVRVDIHTNESMQAYGAMRFSKAALNNEDLSAYERYNYFISFPFDVQVADIYGIGTVGTHWRICYYDGIGRAEEGFFAERTTNWVMIDNTDSVLHAGQGYMLQLNSIQMAASNESVWTNGADVATLYFPALTKIADITTANETIPALGEAYQCTIDLSASLGNSEADRRTKDSYWRCVGVPGFASPEGVSGMPFFYEWNKTNNSLKVISSAGYTFAPTHAYLIQNGNEIVWTNISKPVNAIVSRRAEESFREFRFTLQKGDGTMDQMYIRLTNDEQATAAFDFGQDLIKEMNTGLANIYTLNGYERLAANCLPINEEKTTVPMGVQIEEDDEYLFSLPDGAVDMGVWLMDHETGICTDLGENEYTTFLSSGTYEKRFELYLLSNKDIPLTITHTEWQYNRQGVKKRILQGQLYILQNGRLYDAEGRIVRSFSF